MRPAVIALLVLAVACGRKTEAPVEASAAAETAKPAQAAEDAAPARLDDSWPANFPKPSVDYAGVYDFGAAGEMTEVKIASSGAKQRIALPPGAAFGGANGQWSQVMLTEGAGATMMMWPEGEGAPKIATTMSRADLGAAASAFGVDAARQARAQKTGTDEVAGEACAVYEIAAEAQGDAPGSACVTRDGIPLRVVSGGRTVMLAKSISRGAQDPALFAPPAGYEVVDMGECMRLSAEMMDAVKSGAMPDMSVMGPKMEKCRAVSEKMGSMVGAQ
ncbi:MAG: hypothetical protein HXY21_02205 [Parvularculaceae bacterium]|nr:hypothetical protein [Parvularculaceae bacterium]